MVMFTIVVLLLFVPSITLFAVVDLWNGPRTSQHLTSTRRHQRKHGTALIVALFEIQNLKKVVGSTKKYEICHAGWGRILFFLSHFLDNGISSSLLSS
jgi:hypothetical protein